MKFRTVLMTSAAALALTTNALAEQGDTYVSFFGGASELVDTSFLHYKVIDSENNIDGVFNPNTPLGDGFNQRYVEITLTSLSKIQATTGSGALATQKGQTYSTFQKNSFLVSESARGTLFLNAKYHYEREFSGSVGTEGWVVGAAIGVELFQGLRGEIEVAFRKFDLNDDANINRAILSRTRTRTDATVHFTVPINFGTYDNGLTESGTLTSIAASTQVIKYNRQFDTANLAAFADGELASFSFMANLWYDFPIGDTGIVPFVGVGVGIANLTMDYRMARQAPVTAVLFNAMAATPTATLTHTSDSGATSKFYGTTSTFTRTLQTDMKSDQSVFAYQFGAGVAYEFNNGVRLSAQYRYFATDEADFGPSSAGVETTDIIAGLTIPFGRSR